MEKPPYGQRGDRCSRCGGPRDRQPQRYCKACHAAYQRAHHKPVAGKARKLSASQAERLEKKQEACRAAAMMLLKRGTIVREPCRVCGGPAEMHHPDANRPDLVLWYCADHRAKLRNILQIAPERR